MRRPHLFPLVFLIGLAPAWAMAQSITNVRAQTRGNLVIVQYDLAGKLPGQLFEVKLFGSHNEMQTPLQYVRGDVGPNIVPGRNKRIEWGARKEIGTFDALLSLKLDATLTFSPMVVRTPTAETSVRRGRSYDITWDGGVEQENLQLELWNDSTLNYIITRTPNAGAYNWELPLNLDPGKVYKIRLMSVAAPANYRFSEPFAVRRKIPLALKLAPVGIAAGIGTWLLIRRLTEPEEPPLPEPEGLPNPG